MINNFKKIDLIYLFFLLFSIFIFNKYSNPSSLEINNQEDYISVFDDDIAPFCLNAYENEEYSNFSDINYLKIQFDNQKDWYDNLYETMLSDSNNIEGKYKKRFKAKVILSFKGAEDNCVYDSRIRISGDWRDHLNKTKSLSSMDVSLTSGNIFGITKFKLLLKDTRGSENGKNEVFVSTLLSNLGYLAPRTGLLEVNVNDKSNDTFIFQEKIVKELIEYQKFRESVIIETNEEFFWDFKTGNPFENKYVLLFGKVTNFSWASKSIYNLEIAAQALQKFNLSIFQSVNPKTSLNYDFLGKDESYYFNYDLLNFALGAQHGITNHNRSFYFNKITESFLPIYYDGNSDFLYNPKLNIRDDYSNVQKLKEYAPELINTIESLEVDKLEKSLKNNNLNISSKDLKVLLSELQENVDQIYKVENRNSETLNQGYLKETKKYDIKFVFINFAKNEVHLCNQYLEECNKINIKFELENLVELLNKQNHYLFGTQFGFFNDFKSLEVNVEKITIENSIEIVKFGNPEVIVKDNQIDIEILSIDDKVLFRPIDNNMQNFKNWNINASSSSQEFSEIRQDKNLLTGCVTFYNLNFENTSIKADGMNCEDAINILNSSGTINKIEITDSLFDGLDIDFSNIRIESLDVLNSDNDCSDFSSGMYIIEIASMKNCTDKGISVGENSKINATTIEITNSFIGIAVKDSSSVNLNTFISNEVDYCVAAYRKKQEFAGSIIEINDLSCSELKTSYIQKGSILNVGK